MGTMDGIIGTDTPVHPLLPLIGMLNANRKLITEKENLGKRIKRSWLAEHERKDGSVLKSVEPIYGKVKAAVEKRKDDLDSEDNRYYSLEELRNDALAEVFGPDLYGGIQRMSSIVSIKQLVHLAVTNWLIWCSD